MRKTDHEDEKDVKQTALREPKKEIDENNNINDFFWNQNNAKTMPLFKFIYILTMLHGNISIASKKKIVKKVFREIYKFCFENLNHSS